MLKPQKTHDHLVKRLQPLEGRGGFSTGLPGGEGSGGLLHARHQPHTSLLPRDKVLQAESTLAFQGEVSPIAMASPSSGATSMG